MVAPIYPKNGSGADGHVRKTLLAGKDAEQTIRERLEAEVPEPVEPTFRFVPIGKYQEETPPEYRIHRLLRSGQVMVLVAGYSTKKTFVALHIGLAVAAGQRVLNGLSTNGGTVIFMAEEGIEGIPKRVEAWRRGNPGSAALVNQRFLVPHVCAKAVLTLTDPAELGEFCLTIKEKHPNPQLLIFDTLIDALGPEDDENNNLDLSRAIASAKRIGRETGAAVLVTHHTNAGGGRARGASAILCKADCAASLQNRKGGSVFLSFASTGSLPGKPPKDNACPPDMMIRFATIDLGIDEQDADRERMTSLRVDSITPIEEDAALPASILGPDGKALLADHATLIRGMCSSEESELLTPAQAGALIPNEHKPAERFEVRYAIKNLVSRGIINRVEDKSGRPQYVVPEKTRLWAAEVPEWD